jgi:ribosomal protein S18 acetylase RimI-like enzyme
MALGNEHRRKPEIIIRQMEIDDVSSVYHLGEKLFTSDEFPILYRTWDAYEVTDYFSSDPDYCLVAETEGRIAGFILATTIEKEGTAWKRYGYLSWIGVDEAFQRFDVGLRLYRKLEERLQEEGVRMVITDTDTNNKGAIKFFEALGFSDRAKHVWLAKTLRRPAKRASKTDKVASASTKPEEA